MGDTRLRNIPNTIPLSQGLYIPRFLSNKAKLDPAVFKQEISDVFVFKGIKLSQLSELVQPNSTALSTDQVSQKKITSRFIVLVNNSERDLVEIKLLCTSPIHLIYYDETHDDYNYEQTFGGTCDNLFEYVKLKSKTESLYVTEAEFMKQIESYYVNRRGACVCDKPGMGKSLLLQNIARNIRKQYPGRTVIYIELADFVKKIKPPPEPVVYSLADALRLISNYFNWSSKIAVPLQKAVTEGNHRLELCFDGLDEIANENVDWATEFFKAMWDNKKNNIRLFVTSRPHMRKVMEATYGVMSYDMLPFSKENQVDFLTSYWKQKLRTRRE